MNKSVFKYIAIIILFTQATYAQVVDVTDKSQLLLSKSHVYFGQLDETLDEVKKRKMTLSEGDHINLSFYAKTAVWVKLELHNPSLEPLQRVLEAGNPLLERVTLFDGDKHYDAGMLYIGKEQRHINPSFDLLFEPDETKTLWLRVVNKTTTLQFDLLLKSQDRFYHDDQMYQYSIIIFLGIIFIFMTYAISLFFYAKDSSYLFYTLYLMTLLFQQMTYVGFLPLHAPPWFTKIDNLIVVYKVAAIIIAAAFYAQHFLKTAQYKMIHRIYNFIILFVFVQALLLGTSWLYVPEVTVLSSMVFIVFNTYAGIYAYLHGNRQARFFIAGWTVLIVAYLIINLDAIGVISVMHNFPGLIMWATAIEVMFLLMAFADKLNSVQQQKETLAGELVLAYSEHQKAQEIRTEDKHAGMLKINHEFSYDPENRQLLYCDEFVHLTRKELALLTLLIEAKCQIVDIYVIENTIWPEKAPNESTRRGLVARLRTKLKHQFIETIPGQGCRLVY